MEPFSGKFVVTKVPSITQHVSPQQSDKTLQDNLKPKGLSQYQQMDLVISLNQLAQQKLIIKELHTEITKQQKYIKVTHFDPFCCQSCGSFLFKVHDIQNHVPIATTANTINTIKNDDSSSNVIDTQQTSSTMFDRTDLTIFGLQKKSNVTVGQKMSCCEFFVIWKDWMNFDTSQVGGPIMCPKSSCRAVLGVWADSIKCTCD